MKIEFQKMNISVDNQTNTAFSQIYKVMQLRTALLAKYDTEKLQSIVSDS